MATETKFCVCLINFSQVIKNTTYLNCLFCSPKLSSLPKVVLNTSVHAAFKIRILLCPYLGFLQVRS